MAETVQGISLVADIITILAGIIAVGGIIWAFLARSKMSIHSEVDEQLVSQLTLLFDSIGANPIRDIHIQIGTFLDCGTVTRREGWDAASHLYRGNSLIIFTYDPNSTSFGSKPGANELRFSLADDEGIFAHVQWRSSIFPWTRSSAIYVWPPKLRHTCQRPRRLRFHNKRKTLRHIEAKKKTPPLDVLPHPTRPDHALTIIDAAAATPPLLIQQLPTLVVFMHIGNEGGIAQRRILELFASQNATKISTVIVDMSTGSNLVDKFDISNIPTLIILKDNVVLKRETGYHNYIQLMKATAQYRV